MLKHLIPSNALRLKNACHRGWIKWWALAILLVWIGSDRVTAQGTASRTYLSGEIGLYGELYSMDGRSARRPDNTWNIYLKPTLHIGGVSLPFEFLISSEETSVRQSVNRFTLRPSWSWGGLQVGDFNPRFSEFSLNGERIRGGALRLNPGLFRLAVAAGISQRAVDQDSVQLSEGAFRRTLYAASLGIGREGGSYLDINVLKAKDDTASVEMPGTARPQENLVATVSGQLRLAQSRLIIRGEAAGALYTRDLRSSQFEVEEIPSGLTDIFTPRLSSRFSTAFRVESRYAARGGGVRVHYRRVNPGFVSLGLPFFVNDVEEWGVAPSLRLLHNRWTLRGSFTQRRDNLMDEKRFTTTRQRLVLATSFRARGNFSLSGRYTRYDQDNDAASDSLRIRQLSQSVQVRPVITFLTGSLTQTLALSFYAQFQEGQTGVIIPEDTRILQVQANWAGQWPGSFRLTASVLRQDNHISVSDNNFTTFTFGGGGALLNGKVSPSVSVSITDINNPNATGSTQVNLLGTLTIRPTHRDQIVLSLRNTTFQSEDALFPEFNEVRANLRYIRRFR